MVGLADEDPLLAVARRYLHVTYRSDLFALSSIDDPQAFWTGVRRMSRSRRCEEAGGMREHQLTRWEATSLMVGAGVGAGIMAVPYLTVQVGLVGLALILPVAWAASTLVHLMLAEVLFRTGKDLQIVELMRYYVLKGRVGRWMLWAVFALLSVAFLANLAAYVSGAGEIVARLASIDRHLAEFLVYVVSASVVFFGLKAIGIAERFGALVLVGLVVAIGLGAIPLQFHPPLVPSASASEWLALYGMVMYALLDLLQRTAGRSGSWPRPPRCRWGHRARARRSTAY